MKKILKIFFIICFSQLIFSTTRNPFTFQIANPDNIKFMAICKIHNNSQVFVLINCNSLDFICKKNDKFMNYQVLEILDDSIIISDIYQNEHRILLEKKPLQLIKAEGLGGEQH